MVTDVEDHRSSGVASALADRQECEDVIYRSFEMIDGGRATEAGSLFVADGSHTVEGNVASGPGLAKFFEDREAMVDRRTRHALSNLRFEPVARDEATMRYISVVYVLPEPSPGAVADITDHLVREDGRWRLAHRKIEIVAGGR